MADKTKNCGKGQLTSTDAKELYEAFMRNYEETMEEAGKQIDACLEETFQDRTSSTISDKEECFDEDAAYENYDVGEFKPIDRMEKEDEKKQQTIVEKRMFGGAADEQQDVLEE